MKCQVKHSPKQNVADLSHPMQFRGRMTLDDYDGAKPLFAWTPPFVIFPLPRTREAPERIWKPLLGHPTPKAEWPITGAVPRSSLISPGNLIPRVLPLDTLIDQNSLLPLDRLRYTLHWNLFLCTALFALSSFELSLSGRSYPFRLIAISATQYSVPSLNKNRRLKIGINLNSFDATHSHPNIFPSHPPLDLQNHDLPRQDGERYAQSLRMRLDLVPSVTDYPSNRLRKRSTQIPAKR